MSSDKTPKTPGESAKTAKPIQATINTGKPATEISAAPAITSLYDPSKVVTGASQIDITKLHIPTGGLVGPHLTGVYSPEYATSGVFSGFVGHSGSAFTNISAVSALNPNLYYSPATKSSWDTLLAAGALLGGTSKVTVQKAKDLDATIASLERDIEAKAQKLINAEMGAAKTQKEINELKAKQKELMENTGIRALISRVNAEAQTRLLNSPDFQSKYLSEGKQNVFVLSVDIRRSTELMLKAKTPELYAGFISELCGELKSIITNNFGVFDKFTGDGILAFFPEQYSGEDAGYNVVLSAVKCHEAFVQKYSTSRSSFTSILTEIGLGIGIDYGPASLVQIADGLTVVGVPVVYACRMSSAPAGLTLMNQQGYDQVKDKYQAVLDIKTMELEIKHEGKLLAYAVGLKGKQFTPKVPSWV
jgi:class 3 adenylate cyclase